MYDKEVTLKDGTVLKCNILSKTLNSMVVRTIDNKYYLIAREFLQNPEEFGYKEEEL